MFGWAKAAGLCLFIYFATTALALSGQYAVVAKRTIYPGQVIKLEDLRSVALVREPTIKYRFVTNTQEIVGALAARTILPKRFIPLGSVHPAPVVKAGTPTRVNLQSGALSISVVGIPLADGAPGDSIRFRNPSSGKIFAAEIQADGSAIARKL